jgi:1-deoxy-D-xylulose-5-phosphate synthase
LVHVVTKKGKGYAPAENDPVRFHSASPFEVATGKSSPAKDPVAKTYTSVFRETMVRLGKENNRIVAITAAMPEGTGLDAFRDLYPDRFFDVGIAEAHAVCFAGGLAQQGLKPVVAIYSTFLQRAYDQVIECVALQKAPVVFCLDRAGVVGEDGATHQGVFDIAFFRSIPHMVVMAPKDGRELEDMLAFAVKMPGPVSLRYPKANCPHLNLPVAPVRLGKSEVLKEGDDFALLALGSMVAPAFEAVKALAQEGMEGTLINARFVKPLDTELLAQLESKFKYIITVEDGMLKGGFGSAVQEAVGIPVASMGVPDEFLGCASRTILLETFDLTSAGIIKKVKSLRKIHGVPTY